SLSGTNTSAVVLGTQFSEAVMMPDFRHFAAKVRRDTVLRKVMGGINHPIVDALVGYYWRPAMLLRLGFLPLAAGVEVVAQVLRHGITDFAKHSVAMWAANTHMPLRLTRLDGNEVVELVPRRALGTRKVTRGLEALSQRLGASERRRVGGLIDRL